MTFLHMRYNHSIDRLYDILKATDKLPHGSGIDSQWEVGLTYTKKREVITLKNYWHLLNANGYYTANVPFTVKIPIGDIYNFKIEWNSNTHYAKVCRTDITESLAQTIDVWLDTI